MEYNVIKIMTNLEKTNDFVAVNCDGNQSLYTSGSQTMVCRGQNMVSEIGKIHKTIPNKPHEKVIVIEVPKLTKLLKNYP